MGGFNPFKKPKVARPPPLPPPPAPVGPSDEEVAASEEDERKRKLTQRGRAATILAKQSEDTGGLATKKLMGG